MSFPSIHPPFVRRIKTKQSYGIVITRSIGNKPLRFVCLFVGATFSPFSTADSFSFIRTSFFFESLSLFFYQSPLSPPYVIWPRKPQTTIGKLLAFDDSLTPTKPERLKSLFSNKKASKQERKF